MLDVQTLTTMFGGIGVGVAAVYYIFNMRETMRNRRATWANNMQQSFITEEFQLRFMEVLNWQWSDFDDFKKKYDSSINPHYYAMRHSILTSYDNLGQLYRNGVIDINTFSDIWAFGIVMCWSKFKPIIEGYRGWEYPKGAFSDFEYLADALEKRLSESDPDFGKKMDVFFTIPPVIQ
jgi:hypothetical protein